jgi:hypothetical protein
MKVDNKGPINIPERLYYPLPEAADMLGCTIRDVIHMGAAGVIDLSIYINSWIESSDVKPNERLMVFFDGLDENPEEFCKLDLISLSGDRWSLSGIYEPQPELDSSFKAILRYARIINGFFYLSSYNLIDFEFDYPCDYIWLNSLTAELDFKGFGDVKLHSFHKIKFPSKSICVMADSIKKIKEKTSVFPDISPDKKVESPKTSAKKSELILQLLKLIPDFDGVDLEATSVSKTISIVEAAAAAKGVEIPKTDKNTWSRYLGKK